MAILLTESAVQQIKNQMAKRGKGLGLRVDVKKNGCSGWAYTDDYADAVKTEDRVFEAHATRLVVDGESLAVLDGSTLDFVKDGLQQKCRRPAARPLPFTTPWPQSMRWRCRSPGRRNSLDKWCGT